MDVYIEREENPISLQEWLDYVKTDKDLVLVEVTEGINPITKQKLRIKIQGRTVFGDSEIEYRKGRIGGENSSEKILIKLKEIANKLNAVVFDCGERIDF